MLISEIAYCFCDNPLGYPSFKPLPASVASWQCSSSCFTISITKQRIFVSFGLPEELCHKPTYWIEINILYRLLDAFSTMYTCVDTLLCTPILYVCLNEHSYCTTQKHRYKLYSLRYSVSGSLHLVCMVWFSDLQSMVVPLVGAAPACLRGHGLGPEQHWHEWNAQPSSHHHAVASHTGYRALQIQSQDHMCSLLFLALYPEWRVCQHHRKRVEAGRISVYQSEPSCRALPSRGQTRNELSTVLLLSAYPMSCRVWNQLFHERNLLGPIVSSHRAHYNG